MNRTEVNGRWQADMARCFEELGDNTPDQGFLELEEVFHLEDQTDATTTQNHYNTEEEVK